MSEVRKVRVAVRSLIDGTEIEREYEGEYVFKDYSHNIAYTDHSGNIITIVLLMFDIPEGNDLNALKEMLPLFIVYLVSFVMIAMDRANHHHM